MVIEDGLGKLAARIELVEVFSARFCSVEFTDRVKAGVGTEKLEHLGVVVTDSAVVELLSPA